jgi:hypothetical protein
VASGDYLLTGVKVTPTAIRKVKIEPAIPVKIQEI